jgi:hypothetical protein
MPLSPQKTKVVPGRRYVFDFCYESAKALFEIQGGTYARGNSGHTSGKGISRDADKVNQAQVNGYLIFQLTIDLLTKEYINELATFIRTQTTTDQDSIR